MSNIVTILLESILTVETSRYTIRMWIQEASAYAIDKPANDAIIQKATEIAIAGNDKLGIAHDLIGFLNVNAVEVKDADTIGDTRGDGVVLYKDWP